MNPDLDTLATALCVKADDLLCANPQWVPERPAVGIAPKLSDAELVTLAVISALLGFDSEARFVRFARTHLRPWFPYIPKRDGYNKRLRRSAEMIARVDERDICADMIDHAGLARPGQTLIADKGYRRASLERHRGRTRAELRRTP